MWGTNFALSVLNPYSFLNRPKSGREMSSQQNNVSSKKISETPVSVSLTGPVIVLLASFLIIYLLSYISVVLLIVFGGVLFAIMMKGITEFVTSHTSIHRNWAIILQVAFSSGVDFLNSMDDWSKFISRFCSISYQITRIY